MLMDPLGLERFHRLGPHSLRVVGLEADGGAIMLDYESTAEIFDTDIFGNIATSGGSTSRAGAFSLWRSSKLSLVRVIVRENTAQLGGELSEGGGICLQQSSLMVIDSEFRGNVASNGGSESRGGFASMHAPSTAVFEGSRFASNHAASGVQRSLGGAIWAGEGTSTIVLASSSLMFNIASGTGAARGGALFGGAGVAVQISDSELIVNTADGGLAEGAGIWFAGESLDVKNGTLANNSAVANGMDGSALGAALFLQGLSVKLVDCTVVHNTAIIAGSAVRASGGAVHCAIGTFTQLIGCTLHGNAAGGKGKYQTLLEFYALAITAQRESSAMHIYTVGNLVLDHCLLIERTVAGIEYPASYWIVSDGGRVILHDSIFETQVSQPTIHSYCAATFALAVDRARIAQDRASGARRGQ
jgi:hypothetical protein